MHSKAIIKGAFVAGLMGLLGVGLAGCETMGDAVALAPTVNGDRPIATALGATPGSGEDFLLNVGRRVFFTENSAELSPVSQATLDKQAAWLATYADRKVRVEGYADEKGGAGFNRELGLKRATAMAAYLETRGVSPARIDVATYGNEKFVKRCGDLTCWSQNRRGVTDIVTDTQT